MQRYEPGELVHDGGDNYHTRSHDSLKISNGLWCWWSHGIGGRTALDYLTEVRGMDFTEAVGLILRNGPVSFPEQSRSPPARAALKGLVLPEQNDNNRRVFALPVTRAA